MKKMIVYLCAGILALGLAACGREKDSGESATDTEQSREQSSEEETVPEETAPEEQPGDTGTQPGGTDGAGGYEEGWSEEMEGLKAAVVEELGESYWPDMALLPDMLEMTFGLTADLYEDYMAEMPMIGTNVDTLLIVRAKDDKVEAVESALEAYRDAQIGDTMQYPMNVGKVQASRIETIGNYVLFVQLGADTQEALEEGDEAVISMCQAVNDSVVEIVRARLEEGADN